MNNNGREWISISDMMSGIMMIFMLIAISFMVTVDKDKKELKIQNEKMRDIAKNYHNLQNELYADLNREFKNDLKKWNAIIDNDTTIRFQNPDALFDLGKTQVKEKFKNILRDFFPRYIKILHSNKYKDFISDIQIMGHTSKEWETSVMLDNKYLGNTELSQGRAFQVLKFCFLLPNVKDKQDWLISNLRASGVSFAKPLASDELSRRVEFKVIFKANEQIEKILKASE